MSESTINNSPREVIEKVFPAENDKLHDVLNFLECELDKHQCNQKTKMMIAVMAEEIFVNIAFYAYKKLNTKGDAIITLEFEGDDCYLTFKDKGIEFDPLAKADPDITLSAEERDIGGLGIFMVKKTMSDVKYERKDGYNIFSFKKDIHHAV